MQITINTNKKQELIDITDKIQEIVEKSNIKDGICFLYLAHTSAALMIQENADPNLCDDILKELDKIIPLHNNYKHDKIDGNAAAHIKSSIIGPSEAIPIKNGRLMLGQWQGITLAEFDGPRNRNIIITIIKQ